MAYVVIALCFGVAGGFVGKVKGSSFVLWFLISAAVLLVAIALPALRAKREEAMQE